MYIMVAQDVVLVVAPVLFLHLEGWVVDSVVPAQVRQLLQHLPLLASLGEHMGDKDGLTGPEIPHVQVMHIDNTLYLFDILLELGHWDVGRGGLHHDVVAVLSDGIGRDEDDDGEDVCGDRVQVVNVVPLFHRLAHVRAGEEYDQGGN